MQNRIWRKNVVVVKEEDRNDSYGPKENQRADIGKSSSDSTNQMLPSNVGIIKGSSQRTLVQGRRDSSVSDMELKRGSVTESPSASIFRGKINNLSMTPLSEFEVETDAKTVKRYRY